MREPTLYEQTDAYEAALKKAAAAAEAEPTISEDLSSIVEATGGRLERFDSRLKTVGSLSRKILGTMIEALQQAGYTLVEPSPGWKRFGYKGRNDKFVSPDGQEFELQIHTQASLAAAEECHPLYEEWRLTSTSPERKAKLAALLDQKFAAVPVPDDVELVD